YRIGASASRKWDEDFLREPAVQPTHALHPLPGKKSPLGPHAAVDQFIAAGMDQFSVAASVQMNVQAKNRLDNRLPEPVQ
ncbi:MAG: hypothetical protein ACLQVX_21485, partial [Limisphaerales bacterium]